MEFQLKLSLDNADAQYADGDLNEQALAGYLRQVADKVQDYDTTGTVMDGNGNTIGEYRLWED